MLVSDCKAIERFESEPSCGKRTWLWQRLSPTEVLKGTTLTNLKTNLTSIFLFSCLFFGVEGGEGGGGVESAEDSLASLLGEIENLIVTSCCENWNKLRLDWQFWLESHVPNSRRNIPNRCQVNSMDQHTIRKEYKYFSLADSVNWTLPFPQDALFLLYLVYFFHLNCCFPLRYSHHIFPHLRNERFVLTFLLHLAFCFFFEDYKKQKK